jgi:phage tail-like protein
MAVRDTPYGAYNFVVELNDGSVSSNAVGGFSDVSGISTEFTMMEYRQGNDKQNQVRKVPGLHKAGDVTLKRGIMGVPNFVAWINQVRLDPTFKLGNPVMRWNLVNARPMKWTGPTLAGKGGSDVAMEELVLSSEGFEFAAL